MQTFHSSLVADILKHAASRDQQVPGLQTLVEAYYADVDATDLAGKDAQDWYGAVLAHLKLAGNRKPGEATVRVYNPVFDDHHWQSTHTVVELVNDDMPFLVDTVSLALTRLGYAIHLIVHPVFPVSRDDNGKLTSTSSGAAESWMHLEIDRVTDKGRLESIRNDLANVLSQLRACVEDFTAMSARLALVREELTSTHAGVEATDWQESIAYLDWLRDDNFVFLGYRDYDLKDSAEGVQLAIVPDSGMGLLRGMTRGAYSASFALLPADIRSQARDKMPLLLTKTNSRSTIHRSVYLDCVGIKRYDAAGNVTGERPSWVCIPPRPTIRRRT